MPTYIVTRYSDPLGEQIEDWSRPVVADTPREALKKAGITWPVDEGTERATYACAIDPESDTHDGADALLHYEAEPAAITTWKP